MPAGITGARWRLWTLAAALALATAPVCTASSSDAAGSAVRGAAKMQQKARSKASSKLTSKAKAAIKILFATTPSDAVHSTCLAAIRRGMETLDFAAGCRQEFAEAAAERDCDEFAGRAEEAHEQGYLKDGHLLCGRLVQEHSTRSGQPVADYYTGDQASASSSNSAASSEGSLGAAFAKLVPGLLGSSAPATPAAAATSGSTGGPAKSNIWAEMAALLHGTG
eukprot:TRINITY_DN731_c0_g2_i1.p2 TRINITY_DN731_c0_g2~~TRINITY_DN731_c0_g2_i1.p2  ORF type:complete len:223 (+),score=43.60 TRINITY_DN731_c0_g2_i1:118-786(+)